MNWSEACNSVGYDPCKKQPTPIYTYFAYKNGEVIECSTREEALGISKNTEVVVINSEDIAICRKQQAKLKCKASEVFHNALREKYKHLSDKVYDVCYDNAYENWHSSGYDAVANHMRDYVAFAEGIIEALKEE